MNRKRAKQLNLRIERSQRAGKKWDAFDLQTGEFQASFGATGYDDYYSFLAKEKRGHVPKGTAAKRREAYRSRHAKNMAVQKRGGKFTAGYLSSELLW